MALYPLTLYYGNIIIFQISFTVDIRARRAACQKRIFNAKKVPHFFYGAVILIIKNILSALGIIKYAVYLNQNL